MSNIVNLIFILFMILLSFTVGFGQGERAKKASPAILSKAKLLCASQGGVWYLYKDTVKCNNGPKFEDISEITVVDEGTAQ